MAKKLKIEDPLTNLFDLYEEEGIPESISQETLDIIEMDAGINNGEIVDTAPEMLDFKAPTDSPEKDAEDLDIDKKIDAVYTAAIDTFQQQIGFVEMVDPKFAARNAEVAAQYLNIALGAATAKARIKIDRKRGQQFIPYANGKSATNVIVASREDILNMIDIDNKKTGV
jgi:hypothetical protein